MTTETIETGIQLLLPRLDLADRIEKVPESGRRSVSLDLLHRVALKTDIVAAS